MNAELKHKLLSLPSAPGVYFHKDKNREIIYIGKAAVLKNRVRHYFQKSKQRDPKTIALVSEIADTDWVTVESELEALFLEAEMIRRYLPKYNILLRDDKALSYIRIDYDSNHPTVTYTRRPLDDNARYFGPYYSIYPVKTALRQLRKVFPYSVAKPTSANKARLPMQLGLDPGLEYGKTTLYTYRQNLRRLMSIIAGKRSEVVVTLQKEMNRLATMQKYEEAAKIRNKLYLLESFQKQVIFGDAESIEVSKDYALNDLSTLLCLNGIIKRIEGYDISHMSGRDVVASMVVFTNGISHKSAYRKFKMTVQKNNDFAQMYEVITRRFSEKNKKIWSHPDLLLIDGGKGQLHSAISALKQRGISIPVVGLAKQYEEIIIHKKDSNVHLNEQIVKELAGTLYQSDEFIIVRLPHSTHIIKLLQRIRDESHRFAVSYHSVLKQKRQTNSWLDEVPGVGAATKKKLLRHFGSSKGVQEASESELMEILSERVVRALLLHKSRL